MPRLPKHVVRPALRRIIAAGSAAVVLALAVFAVSPNAHAWVHDEDGHEHAAPQGDGCAIELFASGVSLPLEFAPLAAPGVATLVPPPPAPDDLFLAHPRYLRQPERGPPGC